MCLVKFIFLCIASRPVFASNYGSNLEEFYVVSHVDDLFNNIIVEPRLLFSNSLNEHARERRSTSNESDADNDFKNKLENKIFSTAVTMEIEDWIILLEENSFISLGNQFKETWVLTDTEKTTRGVNDNSTSCQFYTGSVLSDADSKAIVTICDKIYYYGFFETGGKSYFIEPTIHPINGHIVYKAKLPNIGDFMKEDLKDLHVNASITESGSDSNRTPPSGRNAREENLSKGPGNWAGKLKGDENNDPGNKFKNDGNFKQDRKINKKKRCTQCEVGGVFNLTGDTLLDDVNFNFSDEETVSVKKVDKEVEENNSFDDEPEPRVVHWHKKHDDEEVGYFLDTAWETRPYTSKTSPGKKPAEKWLEIALAVDYTVIEFHGKDKIWQYIMALMNIVSAIYKDPSLDANIHLVLARLIFYDDKKDSMIVEGNAKKSLEGANRWNYRLIGKLKYDENPHDVAVWLTREYLGGPSGYAPVAGACDRARSTALNKDEGLASAFTIAHEIAHILGLTHDGDMNAGNKCEDEVMKGTVMAPTVTANFHRFAWSSCSKAEFHRLINQWTCLKNPPGKNHTILQPGTTHTFTMDEQCRMEYGEGYTLCQKFELIEPCTHLWCGHKNSSLYCITKKGPPVEGTQCGFDKWCVDGYCQRVDGRLSGAEGGTGAEAPRAGVWGNWTEWSPCSRPCGYGMRTRHRKCDNPAPEWGGEACQGSAEERSVCRQGRSCWQAPSSDARAERCASLPPQGTSRGWLPYDTDEEDLICRVSCVLWDSGEVVRSGEHLPDGTSCSYENEHHICIEGKCHEYGCDGVENSTAREDRCGVCEGNGESCFDNRLVFNKTLKKDLTRLLVLPRHSRDISVSVSLQSSSDDNQILAYSLLHLALKDRSKKVYRMVVRDPNDMVLAQQNIEDLTSHVWADGHQEGPAAVLGGAALRAGRPPGGLTLQTKGPLHTDITLLISSPTEYVNTVQATLSANYTLSKEELGRYVWALEAPGSGACAACQGGRGAEPECVDSKRGNRTVHSSLCARSKRPEANRDHCNTSCEFHWVPGPWEHCTATCGAKGLSHRQVYCVPLAVANDAEKVSRYMVEAEKCSNDVPPRQQTCNRFMCPAYWLEGSWTKCSSDCRPGISTRPLHCPAPEPEACGTRPSLRWRTCRGRCPQTSPAPGSALSSTGTPSQSCRRDRSPYCALSALLRYCLIPTFQRFCCHSCRPWLRRHAYLN